MQHSWNLILSIICLVANNIHLPCSSFRIACFAWWSFTSDDNIFLFFHNKYSDVFNSLFIFLSSSSSSRNDRCRTRCHSVFKRNYKRFYPLKVWTASLLPPELVFFTNPFACFVIEWNSNVKLPKNKIEFSIERQKFKTEKKTSFRCVRRAVNILDGVVTTGITAKYEISKTLTSIWDARLSVFINIICCSVDLQRTYCKKIFQVSESQFR